MTRDLLSVILDALYAFEDTIKGGDRHWGSYPAPTNDPEATLRTYLGDIIEARKVIVALMPGPRLSPEIRQAMHRVLDEIEAIGPPPPERVASAETQAAFLAAADAMNTLAQLAENDIGLDAKVANGISDRQQWLAGCDWPILGYDTADPPADPTT